MSKLVKIFILIVMAQTIGCASTDSRGGSKELARIFQDYHNWLIKEYPGYAARMGVKDYKFHHKFPDHSKNGYLQRYQTYNQFLDRVTKAAKPSKEDRINARLFEFMLQGAIKSYEFKAHLMPISPLGGYHASFMESYKRMPLKTEFDYQQFIGKMKNYPRYNDQMIALMKQGLAKGYMPAKITFKGFDESISKVIIRNKQKHPLFKPFLNLPKTFSPEFKKSLQKQAWDTIQLFVNPANKKLLDFFQKEYYPKMRKEISIASLPNGREYYKHRVQRETTTDLSYEEIHKIGLGEVQRIKSEMMSIIRNLKFRGGFKQFVKKLRTDSRFYAKSEKELMEKVSYSLKRMDGELPKLFGKLPRTPYGIVKVPDYMAPKSTTAYYWPPPADGSRAGFYYVNTYDLKSRPLYEVEALSYHEAVPGHHLQIALQIENKDLPIFRRGYRSTAYVEGWALYSESLGKELGFYEDPYSDFGRLTYEMWRACRLVVDTGMHGLGWTRDQAIKFMEDNTALSKRNIRAEVDRYISWPGQALGYKIGELKIKELRNLAETQLGKKFDIRKFHDLVLETGPIPLDLLESRVKTYIKESI